MVKFIHTADTHLRTHQYARTSRGEDFARSFLWVVRKACEDDSIDGILHCGDLIDKTGLMPSIHDTLLEAHHMLLDAGKPMYCVTGNHDMVEPPWTEALFQHDRKSDHDGIVCVDGKSFEWKGLKITALPPIEARAMEEKCAELAAGERGDILMWHGMVREFVPYQPDTALPLELLPTAKFKTILLGDIHVRDYRKIGKCVVGYPGSTELCKNDEPLEKSVEVFEFKNGVVKHEPLAVPTRKVLTLRIVDEEHMAEVQKKFSEIGPDEHPMVFLRYNPLLDGARARLDAWADRDRWIYRPEAIPMIAAPDGRMLPYDGQSEELPPDKPVEAFVPNMFPGRDDLADVGVQLVKRPQDAAALLEAFVNQKLEEYENAD